MLHITRVIVNMIYIARAEELKKDDFFLLWIGRRWVWKLVLLDKTEVLLDRDGFWAF